MDGGSLGMLWVGNELRSFMTEYGLAYWKKNVTRRASSEEIQRRMGCYLRNVNRLRLWRDDNCEFDACDHTLLYCQMNDGGFVA